MPTDLTQYHFKRYNGLLAPWLREILDLYQNRHMSPAQIREKMRPKWHNDPRFRYSYRDKSGQEKFYQWLPENQNIAYALRRIGAMPASNRLPPAPCGPIRLRELCPGCDLILNGKRLELWSKASLGRPLDMGGPRDEWLERDPWSDR